MTYSTGIMANVLIREWPGIDINTKSIIKREIREAIKHDCAGMACDRAQWQKILDLGN